MLSTDQAILAIDQTLRTLFGKPQVTERDNPADKIPDTKLTAEQSCDVAGLMRVNHAGEVCAQALYQGQALTARNQQVKQRLKRSAQEENDHLAWCEKRLTELGSHPSRLNPGWYAGSLLIGIITGIAGDKYNLGFVAETEHQVVRHLDKHLQLIPKQDKKSQAILLQMREDETHHADLAIESGAATLPQPINQLMGIVSKLMTSVAYWV